MSAYNELIKNFEKIQYLDRNILEIEEQIKTLPYAHEQSWNELNDVFLSIL